MPTTTDGDIDFNSVPCSMQNLALILGNYCANPEYNPGSDDFYVCNNCCDPAFSPYWDRCETEIRQDPLITQELINDTIAFKEKCDDFMERR